MPEDHLLGVIVQLAQRDESSPFLHDVCAGNLESLRVGENARSFLLDQDALLFPGLEVARRPSVDTFVSLRIEQFRQTQNDAHQVVRAALVVGLLHGR